MSLTPPKTASKTEIPNGTHIARLYQIIHIGIGHYQWQGEEKTSDKIRLTFELCNERKEFKEGEGEKPLSISREFGFSMGKKSHLRPFVEGMLGVALYDEEAKTFDLETLLGRECLVSVVHEEKNGNTYANIASASPLAKGMAAPELSNPKSLIDVDSATEEQIDALPGFLRDKIKSSDNFKARFGEGADIQLPADSISPEDSPF